MINDFSLDGWKYYQQWRRCGKKSCQCYSNLSGQKHGPYWYRRNIKNGGVQYVGKNLPERVISAMDWQRIKGGSIAALREQLELEIQAVKNLWEGYQLSDYDREFLQSAGLGDCFPPEAGTVAEL